MTDFKIYKDVVLDSCKNRERDILPNQHLETIPLAPKGGLVYNVEDETPYYSDGLEWIPMGGVPRIGFSAGIDEAAVADLDVLVDYNLDKQGQFNTGDFNTTTGIFTCPFPGLLVAGLVMFYDIAGVGTPISMVTTHLRHTDSDDNSKGSYPVRVIVGDDSPPRSVAGKFVVKVEEGDKLFLSVAIANVNAAGTVSVLSPTSVYMQMLRRD